MMQPDAYRSIPMDLHISQQGYHPYYRKSHEENPGPPVVQTRILEMRKEKSRDAARSRRGKENYEFYELAKMLPLPGAITTQLDKASIIRLTISFLKLKEFTARGDPPWRRDGPSLKSGSLRSRSMSSVAIDLFEQHQATHILQSLDGFAFALGADGRFLYISETVSIYLGLSQVEMTGSSVFDYIHQQDQSEIADLIGINMCPSPSASSPPASVASDDGSSSNPGPSTPTGYDRPPPTMTLTSNNPAQSLQRSFCVRMKSTLTKRGCHFKSSGYRVVLVLSHLRPQYSYSPSSRKQPPTILGLVGLAIALPPPSVNELRLESDMFVTRLTFDFRISHCEPRISELLDYSAEDITGASMYTLCYAQDVEKLRKCHIDLIQKGQVMSGYYRMMNKNGGYTWLQSCATVICNSKSAEEETIICVNYVLSNVEYPHCVMDCSQLPASRDLRNDDPSSSERGTSPDKEGGRDNTSAGDVDSERHSTPRPNNQEREPYDNVTDLDVEGKRELVNRSSEKCAAVSPGLSAGIYAEPGDNDRLTLGSAAPSPTLEGRYRGPSNQRKRKPTETLDGEGKSPRSRPASSSSSLEVLSLENGSAAAYEGAELDDNNDEKSAAVARPWTRSPTCPSADASCHKTNVRELEDVVNRHLPLNGSPDVLLLKPGSAGPRPPLQWPATALLRQIYVSRESVIRSGAHAAGQLPCTPPEYGGDQPKLAEYVGYLDACGAAMTPPSSVSPRDKLAPPPPPPESAFSEAAAVAAAAAIPHMRHYADTNPLSLKPQLFMHPGNLDGAYGHAQQPQAVDHQLYHHPHHHHPSGFQLYHPPGAGPSKAPLHAPNGAAWFCQPHS